MKKEYAPNFFLAVGLPYSGKSTYSRQLNSQNFIFLSTDEIITNISQRYSVTYGQSFKHLYDFAEMILNKTLEQAVQKENHIYWDQTNLSARTRAKRLARIPDTYRKICLSFEEPNDKLLEYRRNFRHDKIIDDEIYKKLKSQYEPPSLVEGFDQIWHLDPYGTVLEKIEKRYED